MITAENKIKRQKCGTEHHYVYYRCSRKSKTVKCVEPAVRSELLDRQLSELLGGFALPLALADKMREMAEMDERTEKMATGTKIDGLREQTTHLTAKLQRLLDSFLDGVVEREVYVAKKAEIMSKKKSLEEKISDFTLGQIDWVEPLKNWLDKAVSICKIAKSDDQNAKKSLLLEIFGLNLALRDKNITAPPCQNPISPSFNLWFSLRENLKKYRAERGEIAKSLILEP